MSNKKLGNSKVKLKREEGIYQNNFKTTIWLKLKYIYTYKSYILPLTLPKQEVKTLLHVLQRLTV